MVWKIVIITILILILIFVAICVIDCHSLVIRKYELFSEKITGEMRFLLLTDLHGSSFGHDNDRLLRKIESLSFDAIMISGDMFTAVSSGKGIDVALSLLKELSSKYPVYYANGNHELKTKERPDEFGLVYEEYVEKLREFNIHFLSNESVAIEGNCRVFGLDLPFEYYKKSKEYTLSKETIEEYIGNAGLDEYNILLAHNPEYFEGYAAWGADVVLSGHYHGGLMRLPFIGGFISPKFKLFPKTDAGKFTLENTDMVLSCGLGTHTLPIRVFNPGEISYIIVKNK